jgi:NADPH2:quinone reductase
MGGRRPSRTREAAGVIEVVGEGVENIIPGDRVAYFGAGNPGSYAEARVLSADRLVKLPDSIDEVTAAGAMLKGATVEYLIRRTYPVKADDWVLFHAASGHRHRRIQGEGHSRRTKRMPVHHPVSR